MSDSDNTEPVVIAEFEKNARENVRVSLTEYRNVPLLDVRAFYRDGDQWKPGKGLSIRRDQIPALRKALQAAEKAAQTRPSVLAKDADAAA